MKGSVSRAEFLDNSCFPEVPNLCNERHYRVKYGCLPGPALSCQCGCSGKNLILFITLTPYWRVCSVAAKPCNHSETATCPRVLNITRLAVQLHKRVLPSGCSSQQHSPRQALQRGHAPCCAHRRRAGGTGIQPRADTRRVHQLSRQSRCYYSLI